MEDFIDERNKVLIRTGVGKTRVCSVKITWRCGK